MPARRACKCDSHACDICRARKERKRRLMHEWLARPENRERRVAATRARRAEARRQLAPATNTISDEELEKRMVDYFIRKRYDSPEDRPAYA